MDQNQTVNNDLQKAIDDITNTTNVDPVFSDPVAAPSSVPEGDTGELDEPVGPFPEPPKVEMVPPAPEPIAPLESMNIPELNMPDFGVPSIPEPAPMPAQPTMPPLEATPAPITAPAPMPAPTPEFQPQGLNMHQVKEAALRDLIPLLDRLNMNASQKFNIYRNIFENLHDHTVLDPAYRAATEIADDTERAEALLYLIETIDKM